MADIELLQRKLREIAEARGVMLQLRLDHEERKAAQPSSEESSIVEPAAEFVLDDLNAALREMGGFYLRFCEDEKQRPKRHLRDFETEAAAAASAFVRLWYAPALRLQRRRPYAEPDVNTLFDEMQGRAAGIARSVTKDVAHGYVGRERAYSDNSDESKAKPFFSHSTVEKVMVEHWAKIIVVVLVAAGGALIVYLGLL